MKINRQKLLTAYLQKINKIRDDCEDKSHFSIPEIVNIIADLVETGEFNVLPLDRHVLEMAETWKKLEPELSEDANEFFNDIYSRLECAETDNQVFELRLKGEWTAGSKLYTQKEVDSLVAAEYSIGYDDGYEKARQEKINQSNISITDIFRNR